ncbi:MAG: GGDEF domain-containing protein [Oscillospiraceae bacterium]|nr:GGDEF domain-containing protein [Oscillospiraceae bacterium]
MQEKMTALEAYTSRVYRIIVMVIPVFCLIAGVLIVLLHSFGYYPEINEISMWLFVCMDIIYVIIGLYFRKTGVQENGIVPPDKLTQAKYTMAVMGILQWNAITYIWPFRDLWAYSLLFTIVQASFFDVKLVMFTTAGIGGSMFLSWFIGDSRLMPPTDEYYTAGILLRIIGAVMMFVSVNMITYFGGKFLVEELEKYVCYDTLTHLLNRRSMDDYLQKAYQEANHGGTDFCLLMMDIDDFKKVNDTYGHDCGDEVLRYVANTVSAGVRKDDSVFRWGGEEILVLMRSEKTQASLSAERIRRKIEQDTVSYRGKENVSVTITIGISSYRNGITIQQMMDEADQNLYYGKKHGKNQVVSRIPQTESVKFQQEAVQQ